MAKLGFDDTLPFLCDRFDSVLVYDHRAGQEEKLEESLWCQGVYHENLEINSFTSVDEIQLDLMFRRLSFDLAIASGPYQNRYLFCDYILKTPTKYLVLEDYEKSAIIGYGTLEGAIGWRSRVFETSEGAVGLMYRDEIQSIVL